MNDLAAQGLESTAALLGRVRDGDAAARERLVARYLPLLKRWARGRLPGSARGMVDTDDLVQITLLRALDHVNEFEPRREGAFLAYLRTIVLNSVRDEIRRAARRPGREPLSDELELVAGDPSPLERAIGRDAVEDYERALVTLPEEQQEVVILRLELGLDYGEIAEASGRPSANAARMAVSRALVRLAEVMDER